MREKKNDILIVTSLLLLSTAVGFAQSKPIDSAVRRQIDAGNQAWVDGVKQGNTAMIAATYTQDALDCGPTGDCIRGRSAIDAHLKEEKAKYGKASSASVNSVGAVQQGSFVYEWGQAEASFSSGHKVVERYLTAWRQEPDGSWKIFRNLVIPDK